MPSTFEIKQSVTEPLVVVNAPTITFSHRPLQMYKLLFLQNCSNLCPKLFELLSIEF